eukprot:199236-Amphidinium_carterae.1
MQCCRPSVANAVHLWRCESQKCAYLELCRHYALLSKRFSTIFNANGLKRFLSFKPPSLGCPHKKDKPFNLWSQAVK